MDLLFNRKVVKPIRGGGQQLQQRRESVKRDSSRNGRTSNQVSFEEFMSNKVPQKGVGNYSGVRGRASLGALRSPDRGGLGGAPLIKPDQQ